MKYASVCLLIPALMAPLSAAAEERVFVQVPAMIDPAAAIPTAVRSQCAVDTLMGSYALSAIGKRVPAVQAAATSAQAGGDTFVQLTVLSVMGFGGGSWSGPKSMTIRAEVLKGGAVVGTTVLSRSSSGGAFGGFKGTCSILERVAVTLGKDVSGWLARGPSGQAGKPDAAAAAEPQGEPAR